MESAGLVVLIIVGMLYFLPGLIASQRKHANQGAIWAINFLLGWTFLGWIASLVWAMTTDHKPVVNVQQAPASPQPSPGTSQAPTQSNDDRIECPECAELIRPNAKKCRYCGAAVKPEPAHQPKPANPSGPAKFDAPQMAPSETKTCPGCGYVRHGHEDAPAWQCPNCLKAYNKIS